MKMFRLLLLALIAAVAPLSVAAANDDVLIVYDASGSMWGQIDGINKIVIAREVMADLVNSWPDDTNLGLVAYGHRRAGDCKDIETLIEPGPIDRQQFIATVNAINPKGKTPISAALQHAAEVLKYRDTNATIVLISDGLESCQGDPCAVAKALEENGVNFTAHVVGFDLDEQGNEALSCIAANTGGIFVPASNASELEAALQQVQAAVEEQEAESEVEPQLTVELTAPEQVKAGDSFEVSWSAVASAEDQVMLVPVEAEANSSDVALQVGDKRSGTLTAPNKPGSYSVRYVSAGSGQALASAPVQVIGKTEISAPQQVTAGARFDVSWTQSLNGRDWVQIVPAGSKEGQLTSYIRVNNNHEGHLTAPSKTGLYEVRYVLSAGSKTLARTPVEVIEAETGISAPKQVTAGARFDVSWTQPINGRDWVQIVPAGSKEGQLTSYIRVNNNHEGHLTAPSKTGLYEVRYVLSAGSKTLARTPVEVTEPEQSIDGPDKVRAGDPVHVTWAAAINGRDWVQLVPAGYKEGALTNYKRVGGGLETNFKAPDTTGFYELRYVLSAGGRTLASHRLEVVSADAAMSSGASLKVPGQVAPGAAIAVTWDGGADGGDQRISLARASDADFTWIEAHKVNADKALQFTAPEEPGRYEIRYLDVSNMKVLGRAIVEVK